MYPCSFHMSMVKQQTRASRPAGHVRQKNRQSVDLNLKLTSAGYPLSTRHDVWANQTLRTSLQMLDTKQDALLG